MDYVTFPFEKFVSCITTEYDVQADSILALYIEIAKYLRDNPIVSGLTVKEIIDKYLEENPPSVGVVSVNGKTGVVTGLYSAENPPPYPVTSVNGNTGAVTGLYDAQNPPPYPVTSVNGKTGDVVIQEGGGTSGVTSVNGRTGAVTGLYDAQNPPPYPVTSVNGKTGVVTGLYDEENPPPYPVTSFNGETGDINYNPTRLIVARQVDNHTEYIVPPRTIGICSNIFLGQGTLPSGNTMYGTVEWDAVGYLNEGFVFIPKAPLMLDGFYNLNIYKCNMIISNRSNLEAALSYGLDMAVFNNTASTITIKFYSYEF